MYGVKTEDIEPILQEQHGQGGFQDFLTKIKNQYVAETEKLSLERDDIEKLYRYAYIYGEGGFQRRMSVLFDKIDIICEELLRWKNN